MRPMLLVLCALSAIAATPLLQSNFEDGAGGWMTMGEGGAIRVTRDAGGMREGKPSLAFDYEIAPRKLGVAILPVGPAALAGMDQLHFWVKTDHPTAVGIILNEKGGGNYSAVAWSPGNAWQEVKVEARDFTLGERPNDPADPDGKLDIDQVQGIGVTDLGQLFSAASAHPAVPIVVSPHPGKHTLLISGFEALRGAAERKDKLAIDGFETPELLWMTPGGASLRRDDSRAHAPGPAMEVTYDAGGDGIVFFARSLPPDIPPNITHISFDIASEKPAEFVFVIQEHGSGRGEGPRFNTTVEVRGGGKPDHRDLALSAFQLDPNGPPDTAGGLKIATAKSLTIADISAATSAAHGPNRLWICDLRFTSKD